MLKKLHIVFFLILLLGVGFVMRVNVQANNIIERYNPNKEYEVGDVVYFADEDTINLLSSGTATFLGNCARDWKNTAGKDTVFWKTPLQEGYVTIWNQGQTFSTDQIWSATSDGITMTYYRTTATWNGGQHGFVGESANQKITSINHTYSYSKHYGSCHHYYCDCGSYYYNYYNSACYDCYPGTLKYYANGGSGAPSSSTVYTSFPTISSIKPTRFGYKFLGWSINSSATSAGYFPGDSIYVGTGSTKYLYAVWETSKTLNTDSQVTDSTNITISSTVGYFKFTPSVTATYVFESTNSSGDPCAYLYDSSETQLTSNDDSGEGTNTSNFKISYELTAGTTYYYGVKWYSSSTTGTISVQLRRQYNITFDANGGSDIPATQTKLCGDTLTLSTATPTKIGYTFLGWSTVTGSTDIVYSAGGDYTADEDCTLYAVWKAEGTCGDNLAWTLDNSGLFTISGSGSMLDFTATADVPWSACTNDIKTVVINKGITSVGANCFNGCANLTDITIPKSVTVVGNSAFNGCMTQTIDYGGSESLWNKISVGSENEILLTATINYALEDYTVTYATTSNGSGSVTKTNDIIANGEKADLSVVATRVSYPCSGPIGTEKDVPWVFLGWNTDQDATVALEEVVVTSDVTLYPIFKKELTYNFYYADNKLLESKTVTIYNSDTNAKITMPSIGAYLDWEPVEWCNDKFYSEMSDPVRMFDINAEVELRFSSDFYARYKRTTSVSYEVGEYTVTFEPETFTQYYYASGQKTSNIVFMPEIVVTVGEPLFYGWAKNSMDGDVFQSGDRMTVSENTVMYALWQGRTSIPMITVSDNCGLKIVSMSCVMNETLIYYTTDGTEPTPDSDLYTKPIAINGNEDMIFKAIAVNSGYAYSKVIVKKVALNKVETPVSSILPGFVEKNSVVSISTDTPDATIYYTTDGSVPTRNSSVYSSPFTIDETTEICTIAVKDGMKDSDVTVFKYTVIDGSAPYINIATNINDNNTLTATVNITDNSGSAGGSLNLIYDNSVLEVIDVTKGSYIKYANPYIKKDYNDNTIRVVWAGAEELPGGGEILTTTFKLLSTAKAQTLLSIEKAKLSDADANKLTVQSSDSIVLLSSTTQYFDKYKTETMVSDDKKSLAVNLVERAKENGCIITAVYNNDGRLDQWKLTDITTLQNTYTIPLDTALESKQKIKVFVWSSLTNLKPISDVEDVIYE